MDETVLDDLSQQSVTFPGKQVLKMCAWQTSPKGINIKAGKNIHHNPALLLDLKQALLLEKL